MAVRLLFVKISLSNLPVQFIVELSNHLLRRGMQRNKIQIALDVSLALFRSLSLHHSESSRRIKGLIPFIFQFLLSYGNIGGQPVLALGAVAKYGIRNAK